MPGDASESAVYDGSNPWDCYGRFGHIGRENHLDFGTGLECAPLFACRKISMQYRDLKAKAILNGPKRFGCAADFGRSGQKYEDVAVDSRTEKLQYRARHLFMQRAVIRLFFILDI